MSKTAHNTPKIALAVSTALVSVALAGCTTSAAPPASASLAQAQAAIEKGKASKAVKHAEAAVLADPRNSTNRALLGAAYLEAGRFLAAATSFSDALQLGDKDTRTVLSYALAQTALGNNVEAVRILDEYENALDPADRGLALALAGEPRDGARILSNAIRAGQNNAKVRQNLAYAYALEGNWRAARVMVAEDVPANMVSERIAKWAEQARPEAFQQRVAGLLQVTPTYDAGQPAQLALGNFPSQEVLVAQAAQDVVVPAVAVAETPATETDTVELAAVDAAVVATLVAEPAADPVVSPAPEATAFEPVSATSSFETAENSVAQRIISKPVVQELPADYVQAETKPVSRWAANSSQRRMAATSEANGGSHLVQLGSFYTRDAAERAWSIYQDRHAQLDGHDLVITQAEVDGKTYFRVAASGFSENGAASLCSTVKASGAGCIAYAESTPLPGAVDKGVRLASR